MELAKCEEAEDQLEYALTHLHKAIALNDSGQYKDRLETALTRLQLRATLYKTPERPEDLAAMIIEQVPFYRGRRLFPEGLVSQCCLSIHLKFKKGYFRKHVT